METQKALKLSLDDIVFAGRNKTYGAYLLRQLYNKHVTMAAIIASSLFLLLISTPLVARLLDKDAVAALPVPPVITPVDLTILPPTTPPTPPLPPPPADMPKASPAPAPATIRYVPPVVKRDDQVLKDDDIPDIKALADAVISTKTADGEKGSNFLPDEGVPGGTGDAAVADVFVDMPHTFVEQMPSFPGGEKALFAYLGKNMKYPQQAINAGVEGQVFLSFVISRSGEISDIEVLRGLGAGCDEEAVRVIKSMPKWSPGKQNGVAVPVRYNIPIKFALK